MRLRTVASLLLAIAVMLPSADGEARRKRRKKRRKKLPVAALFLVTKDDPNPKTLKLVRRELTKKAKRYELAKVLEGRKLKRKMRKKPEAAISKCGSNLKCIAKLGRKARAKEVMYGRVAPGDTGNPAVKLQFIVVAVRGKEVLRKVTLQIDTPADVSTVLEQQIFEVFGVTDPGLLMVLNALGDVRIDGEVVGEGEGPYELSPGQHAVSTDGLDTTVMVLPGKTERVEVPVQEEGHALATDFGGGDDDEMDLSDIMGRTGEFESAPAGGGEDSAGAEMASADMDDLGAMLEEESGGGSAAMENGHEHDSHDLGLGIEDEAGSLESGTEVAALDIDDVAVPPAAPGGFGLLGYAGIGLLGLGAVGAGAGGYFGLAAGSKRDSIRYGAGGTSQARAESLNKQANSSAGTANMMLYAAGGLVLVGGALLAVDLMTSGNAEQPKLELEVGPGTAALRYQF